MDKTKWDTEAFVQAWANKREEFDRVLEELLEIQGEAKEKIQKEYLQAKRLKLIDDTKYLSVTPTNKQEGCYRVLNKGIIDAAKQLKAEQERDDRLLKRLMERMKEESKKKETRNGGKFKQQKDKESEDDDDGKDQKRRPRNKPRGRFFGKFNKN